MGQSQGITTQMNVQYCWEFDSQCRDKLELIEKDNIKNLLVFIRRCIDVIEFLKIISFDGN